VTALRERLDRMLPKPLVGPSRLLLALLVVPLALTFTAPLWTMRLVAPQYPAGLTLRIYAHTVSGDVDEVNTLNHYIGMGRIDRAALSDLDWIPFAIGALALLAVRVAAIGDLRSLIDLSVLFLYFSAFSLFRFYYKLYVFGHNLDPHAPFQMPSFTPPVFGSAQIANFTATSLPAAGSLWVGVFGVGLLAALFWNLRRARGAAVP
jgi:copper chaperone NosL